MKTPIKRDKPIPIVSYERAMKNKLNNGKKIKPKNQWEKYFSKANMVFMNLIYLKMKI